MDDAKDFLGELKALSEMGASKQLTVGFLEGATYTDGTSVAQVAAIQEFGTARIPARPFFRPSIAEHEDEWSDLLLSHLEAGDDVETTLLHLGSEIKGRVQEQISQVFDPPLAPFTLAKRRARDNKSTKPLIDTGHMRQSVDFRVENIE